MNFIHTPIEYECRTIWFAEYSSILNAQKLKSTKKGTCLRRRCCEMIIIFEFLDFI